jgi:hypothetical protein
VRHAAHHDPANSAINMARYKLAGASINTAFEPCPRGLCGAAQKHRAVDAAQTHVPRNASSIRRATSHAHFRAAELSILELSIQPLLDAMSTATRRACCRAGTRRSISLWNSLYQEGWRLNME